MFSESTAYLQGKDDGFAGRRRNSFDRGSPASHDYLAGQARAREVLNSELSPSGADRESAHG